MKSLIRILGFAVSLSLMPTAASPAIEVIDWNLTSSVGQSPGGSAGDGSNTPQNPYLETELAAFGISSASTIRNYAWSDSEAQFLATANLAAAGSGGGTAMVSANSTAGIFVYASTDLLLETDVSFSYDLAPGDLEARLIVSVYKLNPGPPHVPLVRSEHIALPIVGHPPTGTFDVQHAMLLPSNESYYFSYVMMLWSYSGSPEVLSLGSGHANFSLVVVPDPATGALLAPAMLLAFRRRRHP